VRPIVEWIKHQPALRVILAEAEPVEARLDFGRFHASFEQMYGDFAWPSTTQESQVTLIWNLMNRIATADTAGRGPSLIEHYSMGFA